MVTRKGAGRGTGKGYKNLRSFPRDASIHSQSAKGMKQPQKIPVDIKRKIESGELRQKYGLDTDSGSMYYKLRNLAGDGDTEAQYKVFQSRGIVRKESDEEIKEEYIKKVNSYPYNVLSKISKKEKDEIIDELKSEGKTLEQYDIKKSDSPLKKNKPGKIIFYQHIPTGLFYEVAYYEDGEVQILDETE